MNRSVRTLTVAAAFAMLLASGAALAQSPAPEQTQQQAMHSARELVASGNLRGAVAQLAAFVAAHRGQTDATRLLGDFYYREGDFKDAEATYKKILANNPDDRETHNRLGAVYATENRIDDAIAQYNLSLPGTDSVPDLVRLHQIKGDLSEYIAQLQTKAFEAPLDGPTQTELAKVYYTLHRTALAVEYYERAVDDEPSSLIALNGLGLAYLDEDRYQDAINTFERCRGFERDDYPCAVNMGATYLEWDKPDQAKYILEIAHNLRPEQPEALVNFGYLADMQGDWRKAVAYYLQALNVYPYAVDAYIDLGSEYEQHHLYPLAQSVLVKGLTVSPTDGHLHLILGLVFADQKKNDLARAQFEAAAKSDDPDVKHLAETEVQALTHL